MNTIIQKYLKTGQIFSKKRGGDFEIHSEPGTEKFDLDYVNEHATENLNQISLWVHDN